MKAPAKSWISSFMGVVVGPAFSTVKINVNDGIVNCFFPLVVATPQQAVTIISCGFIDSSAFLRPFNQQISVAQLIHSFAASSRLCDSSSRAATSGLGEMDEIDVSSCPVQSAIIATTAHVRSSSETA
jgi:hypothetical protein